MNNTTLVHFTLVFRSPSLKNPLSLAMDWMFCPEGFCKAHARIHRFTRVGVKLNFSKATLQSLQYCRRRAALPISSTALLPPLSPVRQRKDAQWSKPARVTTKMCQTPTRETHPDSCAAPVPLEVWRVVVTAQHAKKKKRWGGWWWWWCTSQVRTTWLEHSRLPMPSLPLRTDVPST